MTIHSTGNRSDPRVVCGLLAREVLENLEGLQQKKKTEHYEIFLLNFLRLMEQYRFDKFSHREPHGILERSSKRTFKKRNELMQRELKEVKNALFAAQQSAFDDLPTDQVINIVKSVINDVKDDDLTSISADDLNKTRDFLRSLEEHLTK
ncbi:MAG: hypothetical protein JAZ16_07595 [Candidatus Thiodiazotropha taylori]|nr:hypothetical protein [Candidatus Thiodiazotropha taylori]